MRLTRRAALGGALAAGLAAGWTRRNAVPAPMPVAVRAYPIPHLQPSDPARRRFGGLSFRSGLELQSGYREFGGFSGLWRSPDGAGLVALTDNAHWLTARIETAGPALSGLADPVMAPVLGADGRPLFESAAYDTESLAISDGVAYVGIERVHEVMRFELSRDGMLARGAPVAVPREAKRLRSNKGLEALALAPPGHPLAGALIAVAEQARSGPASPTRGFILPGPGQEPGQDTFEIARADGFDVTDIAFLPSGELLLLERRFSIFRGVAVRVRRIAADAIAPGRLVDGPVIFAADSGFQIDNLEGLALHGDGAGATVVTLISDDNYSVLQRTLLLEFTLEA